MVVADGAGRCHTKAPRITGVVVVLVLALASLVPAAVRLWQTRHLIQMVLLAFVGIQAIACLGAIAAEFMLKGIRYEPAVG